MTVVAEAVVKVRADTTTFKAEAETGVSKGLTKLQATAARTESTYRALRTEQQRAELSGKRFIATTETMAAVTTEYLLAQRALLAAEGAAITGLDAESIALRDNTLAKIADIDASLALASAQEKVGRSGSVFRERVGGRESGGILSLLRGGGGFQVFAAIAAFQAFQKLTEALRVTGDEAFTTEGKLRNLSASLLSGDIVGGLQSLFAEAPKLSDDFDKAKKQMQALVTESKKVSLQDVRNQTEKFRDYLREAGTVYEPIANKTAHLTVDMEKTAEKTAKVSDELRQVSLFASTIAPLLAKYPDKIQSASDKAGGLGTAFRQGAADAALMLEYLTKIDRLDLWEKIAKPTFGITPLTPGKNATDKTASEAQSFSNAESIASRTKTLNDDLAVAKKEAAVAAQREKNLQDQVQGRARRHAATVAAQTKVIRLDQEIADQAAAAAAQRKSEAEAAAAERDRLAKQESDRIAQEKADALAAYKGKQDLALLKLRNAQAIADLDGKVTARDIALKKQEIVALGKLANDRKHYTDLERAQFRSEQIQARADLQEMKKGKDEQSATAEDFYRAAVSNFRAYGGGTSGILSAQGARGSLAGRMLGLRSSGTITGTTTGGSGLVQKNASIADPLLTAQNESASRQAEAQSKQLAESRKQTRYLQIIARRTAPLGVASDAARASANTLGAGE